MVWCFGPRIVASLKGHHRMTRGLKHFVYHIIIAAQQVETQLQLTPYLQLPHVAILRWHRARHRPNPPAVQGHDSVQTFFCRTGPLRVLIFMSGATSEVVQPEPLVHYGRMEIPRVPRASPSAKYRAFGEETLPRVLHSGKKCTRGRGSSPSAS
jgi:hypothetical protein